MKINVQTREDGRQAAREIEEHLQGATLDYIQIDPVERTITIKSPFGYKAIVDFRRDDVVVTLC